MTCAYDFSLPGLEGGTLDFSVWRGRPLLIVNTASKCGFTPQYEGLQHLWATFGRNDPDGLVVIGIPSNDFGKQEPGSAKEIGTFCSRNYGVGFPMTAKETVKGGDAIPLFRWLAHEGGFLSRPRWNFYKYLIDREGKLVRWFTPLARPDSAGVVEAVHRVILDR
ncbi:glutathione peroxidase [Gluconobacter wancherniae]|uniref:glutathione peroxidase n=1 Tax=Gluconobacter wancherniae TaxID=1307955 RepID=UPI001B8C0FF7|nr:glutathione peroxidase [Gluconobacter wancherniae]MBS1093507.1 glutathione peroxidase [Gluconobacter wancherniae]